MRTSNLSNETKLYMRTTEFRYILMCVLKCISIQYVLKCTIAFCYILFIFAVFLYFMKLWLLFLQSTVAICPLSLLMCPFKLFPFLAVKIFSSFYTHFYPVLELLWTILKNFQICDVLWRHVTVHFLMFVVASPIHHYFVTLVYTCNSCKIYSCRVED